MIAVYVAPDELTREKYDAVSAKLEAAGVSFDNRVHHSLIGEEGHLMVYEIWESQDAYTAFEAVLMPILKEVGVTSSRPPDVMAVAVLDQ